MVIRGLLRGHNNTPCGRPSPGQPVGRPGVGRPQGVVGVIINFQHCPPDRANHLCLRRSCRGRRRGSPTRRPDRVVQTSVRSSRLGGVCRRHIGSLDPSSEREKIIKSQLIKFYQRKIVTKEAMLEQVQLKMMFLTGSQWISMISRCCHVNIRGR
jgi:hypothetical protein